jgi:hypothetical protein
MIMEGVGGQDCTSVFPRSYARRGGQVHFATVVAQNYQAALSVASFGKSVFTIGLPSSAPHTAAFCEANKRRGWLCLIASRGQQPRRGRAKPRRCGSAGRPVRPRVHPREDPAVLAEFDAPTKAQKVR